MYTLDQFRADPTRFYHEEADTPHVRLTLDIDDGPGDPEYLEVHLMTDNGCIVTGHYMMPNDWLIAGTQDAAGNGIYLIPWDKVEAIVSEKEAETALNCLAVDYQLLSYAR